MRICNPVVFVLPERADVSECRFLHGSIGARRRAGITETNLLASGEVCGYIPLEIAGTVIAVQYVSRSSLPFKAPNAGAPNLANPDMSIFRKQVLGRATRTGSGGNAADAARCAAFPPSTTSPPSGS